MSLPFPQEIQQRIADAVERQAVDIEPLIGGGSWGRAFLVSSNHDRWVARIEANPRPRATRIPLVQEKARSVGILTPAIVAYGTESVDSIDYLWIVEPYLAGTEFYPEEMEEAPRRILCEQISRQLRRLHTIEVDGFWSLAPDLLSARFSWRDWINEEVEKIQLIAQEDADWPFSAVQDTCKELETLYDGPGCLCHGDFGGSNILINGTTLVGIIDWENAVSCDPAYDLAYWYSWHNEQVLLDYVIAAYHPDDITRFISRVYAHAVAISADFIGYYREREDPEGLVHSKHALRINLARFERSLAS